MDNQNLIAFISAAEKKSFSKAAAILDVTQSTISKRIAQLEFKVGKKLFDRIARKVHLTEAGKELLPRAKLITKEYEHALQAINDLSGSVRGPLQLAISHHLGLHRLPKLLKTFTQKYPDVTLDIEFMDSEKAYDQVLNGHSDVAVITLALDQHPNIRRQKIWNDPLQFACSREHPLARLTNPELIDLAHFPVILPGLNTYTGRIVQQLFTSKNIPLTAPMSTNYLETISAMVEIGLGWSVLPDTLTKSLYVLSLNKHKIQRELGYICHTKRTLSRAASAFLALLDSEVSLQKQAR
jgi:DNA-binding transcriptional LysR family regulator